MADSSQTVYDQIGPAGFERLITGFYRRVAGDPVLRPMYPEGDLAPAARRLRLFLEQRFGGPATYDEERGHPRLRMRHAPFTIRRRAMCGCAICWPRLTRPTSRNRRIQRCATTSSAPPPL